MALFTYLLLLLFIYIHVVCFIFLDLLCTTFLYKKMKSSIVFFSLPSSGSIAREAYAVPCVNFQHAPGIPLDLIFIAATTRSSVSAVSLSAPAVHSLPTQE